MNKSTIILTGLIGLAGAILTGIGEFVLHFDTLARYDANNSFFLGISDSRTNLGHFIAVLGAPLYFLGCWHIRLMLQPASDRLSMLAYLIGLYSFALGLVWIGSRASLSALLNFQGTIDLDSLLGLYDLRYESLITIVRIAMLLLSAIYIGLVLTGKSHYPKWMAILNPILLIAVSFIVYVITPSLGKYLLPIALNVGFAIFFAASIVVAKKQGL